MNKLGVKVPEIPTAQVLSEGGVLKIYNLQGIRIVSILLTITRPLQTSREKARRWVTLHK